MKTYLLGIDNGGTLCKAAAFDLTGHQVLEKSIQIPLTVDAMGKTQRDPQTVMDKNLELIAEVCAELDGPVAAVGLSGHGKGLYCLDRAGKPLLAIGSTDSRALEFALQAHNGELGKTVYPHTFQKILACQPVCILRWLKEHDRSTYDAIGTVFSVKDLVGYALTGQTAAEITDMSGTNLLSLKTRRYDPALTALFGISEMDECLPKLIGSFDVRGCVTEETAERTGLPAGIPVAGGMFDIDACALAAGTAGEGDLCMIAGTWSINEYISPVPVKQVSMNSLWCDGKLYLAEESSAASAGNLEWMRRFFAGRSYEELNALVEAVPPERSCPVFFPFLFASNLDPMAKAAMIGLESGFGEGEILRAVYEGVVFSSFTHLESILNSLPRRPDKIRLAGGVTASPVWVQMFADAVGIPMEITEQTELGCKGAAMAAGVAAGLFRDLEDAISKCVRPGRLIQPDMTRHAIYQKKYEIYRQAEAALGPVWQKMRDFACQ